MGSRAEEERSEERRRPPRLFEGLRTTAEAQIKCDCGNKSWQLFIYFKDGEVVTAGCKHRGNALMYRHSHPDLGWTAYWRKKEGSVRVVSLFPYGVCGLFPTGRVLSTPGALGALGRAGQSAAEFLERHLNGDWGEITAIDVDENNFSLKNGYRILSAYNTKTGERIWIVTEADRSMTTILLPEEYH